MTPDTALQLVVSEDHRVHMCGSHMCTHMHTRYSERGLDSPKDAFASQPFRSKSRTIRHSKQGTEKGTGREEILNLPSLLAHLSLTSVYHAPLGHGGP